VSEFELDPRLAGDSIALGNIGCVHVRAMANATWPWLVLIPMHPEAVELHDLPETVGNELHATTLRLARALKQAFAADKINIAALGNVVSQLHVHIVARQVGDPGWPSPVWGRNEAELSADQAEERLLQLRNCLLPLDQIDRSMPGLARNASQA
jgi:diadenosine tetraphosphate (Ap4A) HIT family hydrolase